MHEQIVDDPCPVGLVDSCLKHLTSHLPGEVSNPGDRLHRIGDAARLISGLCPETISGITIEGAGDLTEVCVVTRLFSWVGCIAQNNGNALTELSLGGLVSAIPDCTGTNAEIHVL